MRELLVHVSDLHIQGTTGLVSPDAELDDGGQWQPSKGQRWLWGVWNDFWERVANICDRYNVDRLIVVIGGDAVEGVHHKTQQVYTLSDADVIKEAIKILAPIKEIADDFYMVRGTESHTGPSAKNEEIIGSILKAKKTPEGKFTWWMLPLEIQGARFVFTHHGPIGGKPWTESNVLNSMAVEIEYEYMVNGMDVPHIHVQAHNHRFGEGHGRKLHLISAPAWQLKTAYVHRKYKGHTISHIGGLVFLIEDGIVRPVYTAPGEVLPTWWVAKGVYRPLMGHEWEKLNDRTNYNRGDPTRN